MKQALKRSLLRIRECLPRKSGHHDVLLLCQNGLMADYLGPVWELLNQEPNLRFFLTYPKDERIAHEVDRIRSRLPVKVIRLGAAECRPWDLILTADHGYEGLATRQRCPVIYTGHGMTGKVVEGEEGDYSYGPRTKLADGSPRYSAMLESSEVNRARIHDKDPVLGSTIRVVGSLQDDRLLSRLGERDAMRERLGYKPSDKVILVQSSWGPSCRFHTVGEKLLRAIEDAPDYKFVLSVHPHEYRPTADGSPSWGDRLRDFAATAPEGNVSVRDPDEPWIPQLIVSDLVISDHTSLVIYGALAKKPTLWVPVADELIQEGTALSKLRSLSPVMPDPSTLVQSIEDALAHYPHDAVADLANEINSRPGQARARIRAVVGEALGLQRLGTELAEIEALADQASPQLKRAPAQVR